MPTGEGGPEGTGLNGNGKVEITLLTHGEGGFANTVEVDPGTTLEQALRLKMPMGFDPSGHQIRVGGEQKSAGYVLQPGDSVTIKPVNLAVRGNGS
jgi:hypothetical protein